MFTYVQETGNMYGPDNKFIGQGFAGHGVGMNNPKTQAMRGIGPLPVGMYSIGDEEDNSHLGPCAMRLTPDIKNEMFSRSGFFIHGVNPNHPLLSSDGCICLTASFRRIVADSDDDDLNVVAHESDKTF